MAEQKQTTWKRALVTAAFIVIGAAAGFLLPLGILMGLAAIVSWSYADPAAGGVLSFLMIPLGPIGVAAGIVLGVMYANSLYVEKARRSAQRQLRHGRRSFFKGVFRADSRED